MAIEWYDMTDYVSVGINWNVTSVTETSYSIAPIIYRWDNQNTNNYSSSFSETLNPQPNGEAGYWSGYSWGSGYGTRRVDSFSTRTYEKTTSTQTISLTIEWDDSFGSYHNGSFITLGSGSYTWTCTIPALASYTISYSANGGTGAPGNQTKWYGKTLNLSTTKPTRNGYNFVGWGTSAADTDVKYHAGGQYTKNASITLYAIWVSAAKMKMTLSSTTATYLVNGQYTNNNFTDGDTTTLYAVWKKNALPILYMNVGDKEIKGIYVNIPSDKNIKSIYYKIK